MKTIKERKLSGVEDRDGSFISGMEDAFRM